MNNKFLVIINSDANIIGLLMDNTYISEPLNAALESHYDLPTVVNKIHPADIDYNIKCEITVGDLDNPQECNNEE